MNILHLGTLPRELKKKEKEAIQKNKKIQIQIQEIFFILGYGRNVTFVRICYNFS